MIVGCKLPHGHTIEHKGETIALNGGNIGYDPMNPFRQGAAPDSLLRASGAGLTKLDGKQAEAFKDWYDLHKDGGPIASGAIYIAPSDEGARKEAKSREKVKTGVDALDPDKDLPKGVETAKED